MKIGIVGAGKIGGTLTRRLRALGHDVRVANSPVFKVFNGIYWQHLLERGRAKGEGNRIALPIAGADGPARQLVFDLVDDLGFDPVNGGNLAESWRQQPGTPVYGKDYGVADTEQALAEATPERPAEFRAPRP